VTAVELQAEAAADEAIYLARKAVDASLAVVACILKYWLIVFL
jgi:hypothetical protein